MVIYNNNSIQWTNLVFNSSLYKRKRIIRLTEADIRKAISEALEEVVADNQAEPVDGGNAAGRQLSPSAISFSLV